MKFIDMTGQKFGRLVVLGHAGTHIKAGGQKASLWLCRCSCGSAIKALGSNLRRGQTNSCGCYVTMMLTNGLVHLRHGHTRVGHHSSEYRSFSAASQRCTNPNVWNYHNYGGRGIKFLFTSFEQFFAELGPRPKGMTLDRIDNDGNYGPGNVRWATRSQQEQNKGRQCQQVQ